MPSIYREFDLDDWNQWKGISIRAHHDPDGEDQQIIFRHEVWDQHNACPFLGAPVTVRVNDTTNEPVTVSIDDATVVNEGETAFFDVRLNKAATETVTVEYRTANGSAHADSDYVARSDTLTFSPGRQVNAIAVRTLNDNIRESTETFTVTLRNASGAAIRDGTATGTIDDDDIGTEGTASLTISNVTVTEGANAVFRATLGSDAGQPVTVTYETVDGTAVAPSDYTHKSGSLTLAPGEAETIAVETTEDNDEEQTEAFTVTLTDSGNVVVASATGTIHDDDGAPPPPPPPPPLPTLSIGNAAASEGDPVVFTVTLTGTRTGNVTVAYATADGSAHDDSDYADTSGTLTFSPTEGSHTISVPTTEDTDQEETETFTLILSSPTGATIADDTGTGTINDDDGGTQPPPPTPTLPTLSIGNAAASEGDPVVFTVTISGTRTGNVTVAYATADGSAHDDSDYADTSGTLTFSPTEGSHTISVPTTEDTDQEETETFAVTLSNPSGATIADDTGTGTINDDDGGTQPPPPTLPVLSIDDAAASEGDPVVFTVTISGTRTGNVTVAYATADGSAHDDSDYADTSGTLTFSPAEGSHTISVPTTEDADQEETETFTVTLSSPTGATIADDTGTGTINDDDGGTQPPPPPPTLPTLSIKDATVEEGGSAAFEVTLSPPGDQTVTVAYATADGTAVQDSDYTETSGTLTFVPGEEMMTISVQTTEDTVQEDDETFTVTLSNPTGATIEDGDATGTITDDDDITPPLPTLSIADATVEEGEVAEFTVTLSGARTGLVTVAYSTADVTAAAGDDYTSTSGSLSFETNETTKTISVPTLDDSDEEEAETFTVTLSSPAGATIEDGDATGTVTDDDDDITPPLPTLSIGDAIVEEGEVAEFTVTLTGTPTRSVTVAYSTADGTAEAGADYTSTSGSLTFATDETSKTINVATLEDTVEEQTETFTVTLSNPAGAAIEDGSGTGTITDDDGPVTALPRLNIADATVEEGETARFLVTLSRTSTQTVTVAYATVAGTARQGSDYTGRSGTLRFAPGEASKTIPVPTVEDTTEEQTETFTVTLSNPAGATIEDGSATGTITDDDGPVTALPRLNIADATVEEGETARFLVTLSRTSTRAVTVAYATADGTAREGSDYAATSGTLRFAPGEASKIIAVPTVEDTTEEQTETFTVTLSNPAGATIEDGSGTGTITDDDGAVTALPRLNIADATVAEGETARFLVTLSRTSTRAVNVAYATADGTAREGSDYAATSGTLRFAPGEASKIIAVPTVEDTTEEQTETFTVTLSNPAGATIEDGSGTGTITDDDGAVTALPRLNIADATVAEGETARFLVTLSRASTQTVTVAYGTADGTAREGSDYAATSGTLRFAPGEASKTIPVPTVEDTTEEETETFTVTLSNPAGATVENGSGTGTITDDDGPVAALPLLNIADATVEEGKTARFLVTLSRTGTQAVTVAYATADGTARQGSDYTATSGTLRFAPGEASKTIPVPTVEDTTEEPTETFTVTLSNPAGATVEDGSATGTITDVEPVTPLPALAIADAEAKEGDTAEFVVTLRPASDETATVSFRTVDGTATAGLDYASAMGTLRFEPGETSATVAVSTLTDELAEGAERFTLELSDPVAATVADGTGVGTITDDHTARIRTVNRTVLPEVGRALAFNAVTCRFDRPLSPPTAGNGTQRSAAHLSLPRGLVTGRRTSPGNPWTSPAGPGTPPGNPWTSPAGPGLPPGEPWTSPTGPGLPPAEPWTSPAGPGMPPGDPWTSPAGPPLTLEQALANSSFLMPSTTDRGGAGRYTAWGCADYRHLGGSGSGGLAWNGAAFSVQVGADVELGAKVLAGVSLSRSRSSFGFGGGEHADPRGGNELSLTGVNPYVAWLATPDLDVWGTVGHAWGDYRLDDHLGAGTLTSAATLDSATVGIGGRLLARGGAMLRLRGEGGLAHLGVAGDGDTLAATGLDMRRVRLSTEASYEHLFPFGATLTPWSELGLRHDGGDGETGAGLEVRAGLRYRDLRRGLTIEGHGRRLVAHEGALRESGYGLVLRVDPGESGLGPSLSVTPAWGAAAGGVHQLWERGAGGLSMFDPPGAHVNARFGYGFAALDGSGLLTPFGALRVSGEQERAYRLGAALSLGRSASLSLEAERRRRLPVRALHAVMLRAMLQF